MSSPTPEERVRELAQDLVPVRPIPPLRAALGAALVLGLLGMALPWAFGGPALRGAGTWSSPVFLVILLGLAAMTAGAIPAALAAAVPGREAAESLGARCAVAGFAVALLGGLWGLAGVGGPADLGPLSYCVVRALALGIAPTLLVCFFIVRAVARRPGRGAALVLAGSVALGAGVVHATCASDSPAHWIAAHTLAPAFGALVLTAPIAGLIALGARRS